MTRSYVPFKFTDKNYNIVAYFQDHLQGYICPALTPWLGGNEVKNDSNNEQKRERKEKRGKL